MICMVWSRSLLCSSLQGWDGDSCPFSSAVPSVLLSPQFPCPLTLLSPALPRPLLVVNWFHWGTWHCWIPGWWQVAKSRHMVGFYFNGALIDI